MATKTDRKRPRDSNGSPLLSQLEVSTILGCTKRYVRKLRAQGDLGGIEHDGCHYFTREEVQRLQHRRSHGNGAAFKAFEAGLSPVQVVTQHDLDPDRVAYLHTQWHRLQHRIAIEAPTSPVQWEAVYKLRLESLTPAQLLKCVEIVCADPALRAQLGANG